ncbi:MAG: RHS repeat domain-containing protein, partial [Planctomycetaceae bacterium]
SYQLTAEHRSGTHSYAHTFTYDSVGNREVLNEDGVLTTTTYDDANQIVFSEAATGRTTYTFDANGNQQLTLTPTGGRTTNVWDYENRMTSTLMPGSVVNTMTYKADGLRVTLEESTGTKTFLWDDQNYLSQSDGGVLVFTNEPAYYGNLLSQHDGTDTNWYHFDARGDTRRSTEENQTSGSPKTYRAWGQVEAGIETPFGMLGRIGYYTFSGQAYVRARTYSVRSASWYSRDILFPASGQNPYEYCQSNPTNSVDPSGLLSISKPRGQGVKLQNCGQFCYGADWELDPAREVEFDGFIIQRVKVKMLAETCDGERIAFFEKCQANTGLVVAESTDVNKRRASTLEYYEMWPVRGSRIHQTKRDLYPANLVHDRLGLCLDAMSRSLEPFEITTTAFFLTKIHPVFGWADPPGGWGAWGAGSVSWAGNLLSRCAPARVPRELVPPANAITRRIKYEWDCCCDDCSGKLSGTIPGFNKEIIFNRCDRLTCTDTDCTTK